LTNSYFPFLKRLTETSLAHQPSRDTTDRLQPMLHEANAATNRCFI
jgi:hypothetical protein